MTKIISFCFASAFASAFAFAFALALALPFLLFPLPSAAETLEQVQGAAQSASRSGAASQSRINDIDDATQTLLYEYRARLRQLQALEAYNAQLKILITAQDKDAKSLRTQIDSVVHIDRALMPLMVRMIKALEQFVTLDIPFLKEERHLRVSALHLLMDRADISVAEKYRKIIEAYEIENEYGRTLEVYDGAITLQGETRQVQFLRIGRVALLYQTANGEATGLWVAAQKQFQAWDGDVSALRQAFRVGRNQAAADFLIVPLSVAPFGQEQAQEEIQ
ncbi:MAG: DUF3450 domain-containing protein [Alphaproteobacteria bacterium]|nr:DUF3450 domain-containing protein [Alphaproteobacteria bacterium]